MLVDGGVLLVAGIVNGVIKIGVSNANANVYIYRYSNNY